MKKAVIYLHGRGGNAEEAEHYRTLFPDCDVIGFDYRAQTPWEAKDEFPSYFRALPYESVSVIANSIGAFFAMHALGEANIERAYFISPVVDMEKLIRNMMLWAGVSEDELRQKQTIETGFGEVLSWDYLCYVRSHPIDWKVPTSILYGEKDELTSLETITAFAEQTGAALEIMPEGEHWFHTPEQMAFLDHWIQKI